MLNLKEKQLLANTLRITSCQMVEKAESGHPGMPLGFADAMIAILTHINFDSNDPNWINRDRLIFSCGHGCALWYSVLFGFGILSEDDLSNFRQLHSKTPGHLELSEGIDITTGPLGMGFAWGIGMALGERLSNSRTKAINHHTYIICSDGDLMEGVSYEAASIAGNFKLNKIIALWDDNEITIDGTTAISRTENMEKRFESANWNFIKCNGHDIEEIEKAIEQAKNSDKPTLIACKTLIGRYSELENTSKAHGAPLGSTNFEKLKSKLEYYSRNEFLEKFETIKQQASRKKSEWNEKHSNEINAQSLQQLKLSQTMELKELLLKAEATRKHSQEILEQLLRQNDNLIIASADLASSCYTWPKSGKLITYSDFSGNILPCGIREHAMVAITGGITLHGYLRAIASTFLTFYDYARPAIRLAALMKTPLIMIGTHDSIALGEDGPTHQSIEHLDSLRCMPNLIVARPCDGFETFYCYEQLIKSNNPSILVLSRQKLPQIHKDFIKEEDLTLFGENSENGYIISTGSETQLALEAAKQLKKTLISMPIFKQKECSSEKIHIIEASTGMCWNYLYPKAKIYNITSFGESGKAEDLLKHFKFTESDIIEWIKKTDNNQ